MRLHPGLATVAALLAACASQPLVPSETAPVPTQVRDAIASTLLDAAIRDIASSSSPTNLGVAFVRVDDGDPSDTVLTHLAHSPLPVAPFSACYREQLVPPAVGYAFRERHTNRAGFLVFVVVEGRPASSPFIRATYGWDRGALAMRSKTVLLESRNGSWLITSVLFDVQS